MKRVLTIGTLLAWLWVTAALAQSPEPQAQLQLLAEGLTAPVAVVAAPDDSGRLFVVDQIGVIKTMSADGTLADTPFLDLRDKLVELDQDYDERGLLGLAFHPDYAQNGLFYVYYSAPLREGAPEEWSSTSHLSVFQVSGDPEVADATSENVLLEVDEPQLNHNAGQIVFGPDSYLYVPLGDGGGANDEDMGHVDDWFDTNDGGNGQDLSTNLLGTILRIDVDSQTDDKAYGIPSDNPFVGQQGGRRGLGLRFPQPLARHVRLANGRPLRRRPGPRAF